MIRWANLCAPVAACVLAGALAACGGGTGELDDPAEALAFDDTADASGAEVRIEVFQFSEPEVVVAPGETVTWTNDDSIVHTVTSGQREYGEMGVVTATELDGTFDFSLDGRRDDTATAAWTFDDAGVYYVICTIHPGIDMTVVVE